MNDSIIPFSYRKLADKRRAMPAFFALVAVSAILVVVSMSIKRYAGLVSLLAVIGLTASMLFYVRYITSEYTYSVCEGRDGKPFLIFTRIIGKRQSVMGCIPLSSIKSIQRFTKNDFKEYKSEKGARKYNFAPSFSPDVIYLVLAKTKNETYEMVIEGSDELSARLLEYAAYALEDDAERAAQESDE